MLDIDESYATLPIDLVVVRCVQQVFYVSPRQTKQLTKATLIAVEAAITSPRHPSARSNADLRQQHRIDQKYSHRREIRQVHKIHISRHICRSIELLFMATSFLHFSFIKVPVIIARRVKEALEDESVIKERRSVVYKVNKLLFPIIWSIRDVADKVEISSSRAKMATVDGNKYINRQTGS